MDRRRADALRSRRKERGHLFASMPEAELQAYVEQLLRLCGWLVYHTHDSRKSEPGFPDVCAVRAGQLLFAELKAEGKRPERAQRHWIAELKRAGIRVYVWWPSDWLDGTIERVAKTPIGEDLPSPRDLLAEESAG